MCIHISDDECPSEINVLAIHPCSVAHRFGKAGNLTRRSHDPSHHTPSHTCGPPPKYRRPRPVVVAFVAPIERIIRVRNLFVYIVQIAAARI